MPLIVYRGQGRNRERAKTAPQWKLLHEMPNGSTQPDAFIESTMANLNLWGNYYAEKVKAGLNGRPIVGELWQLPPSKVTVTRDRKGAKRFDIDGYPETLGSDRILHIPAFGYDGLVGLSPIAMFRNTLGAETARAEFGSRWFANSANPGGVLETDKVLDDLGARKLKRRWEALHRGLRNFGRTAVLEDGVKWKPMTMPFVDQQFVEQSRFGVNRVARIFQVPPEKVGGDRSSTSITYANVQSANLDFVVYSLLRWITRLEQGFKFDRDIFPEGLDLYPEFLVDSFLRGAPMDRATFYEKMHSIVSPDGIPALTVFEIRELENRLTRGDDLELEAREPEPTPTDTGDGAAAAGANGDGAVDLTELTPA
jgi:HK97 family phage portal protein